MKTTQPLQRQSSLTAALAVAVPILSLLLPSSLHAVSQKFTSSGTFTPPAGVTSVTVECWGGGGAGGSAQTTTSVITAGGGAGGGAYAKKVNIPVTPGTPYTVTIPAAAASPASGFATGDRVNGATVTFTGDGDVSVTANGGQGGACAVEIAGSSSRLGTGGTAGSGLDAAWAGGNGQSTTAGGVGGSAASDLSNGSQGSTATKIGSDADHNGGGGGTGVTGTNNGGVGAAPGGGGGGGRTQTVGLKRGGSGGKGQIIITYSGGTVTKADNADDLNLTTSWVGGNAPDSSGMAKWDNTVQAANTTVLGADLAWGGITIANPGGLVTINAGNTLALNGGIDMSAATADLTLNCNIALGGPTTWDVAASRTLTLAGIISGNFNIAKQGAGRAILSGANTYSGVVAISGGTLQLGASDVIPHGTSKGDVSVAATCTLDLNSYSDTINGLSGAGTVDNTAASTASTLTVGGNNVDSTFSGVIQNSGSGSTLNLVKTGSGQLTLSGHNTFTGTAQVNAGALNLGTATPLANISGLTLGSVQLGYQVNNAVISAPITLSGSVTVIQNSSGALLASLNGPIGGTGNMTFTTNVSTMNGDNKVSLGAASNFTGNVTITTTSSQVTNNMTVRLGAVNALPTTAVVTLDGQNGNGNSWADLNLFGFDQTLAGLKNITRTSRLQRVYNSSATAATLTIENTTDYSFGGTLGKASGDNFSLTKSGSGMFTLSGANTFTGTTKITSGILSLGHSQSLQNSALDTLNSIAGDLTNGLQTTVTSLTIGGLTGNKDLAAMFETTSGGYSGVTALTLKPGTGTTPMYSGIISDGAVGMTLTKTGAGTQTLSGANTYTGTTTISAGTLALGASNTLPDTTAVAISSATLDAGDYDDTVGSLDVTGAATINLGANANLVFADSSGITWSGTLNLTGSFVSGSSLRFGTSSSGLTSTQLALISATGVNSFALDANGYLTTSTPGGYSSWQSANSPAGAMDQDHDNDGVENGIEYFLGGTASTTGFTPLPGVINTAGTRSITWTKAASYKGNYGTDFVVETSATLTDPWVSEVLDVNVTVIGDAVKYTFPVGTMNFARLKVTGP